MKQVFIPESNNRILLFAVGIKIREFMQQPNILILNGKCRRKIIGNQGKKGVLELTVISFLFAKPDATSDQE